MHKPATNSLGNRPILLVDDNPMDIDLTLQAFAENNITNPVQVYRDGEEALEYIQHHEMLDTLQVPALVLLDLHLPKVCGFDVLRLARLEPLWTLIPFIILTSSRESADIALAYELGANAYFTKPLDIAEFKNTIRTITPYWMQK